METLILNWLVVLGTTLGVVVGILIVTSLIIWENIAKLAGFWLIFRIYLFLAFVVVLQFRDRLFVWS